MGSDGLWDCVFLNYEIVIDLNVWVFCKGIWCKIKYD